MDLGTAFAVAVARAPGAEAVVDGGMRRTYSEWYGEVRTVAGGLTRIGLRPGDHLVAVLANRIEMATLYWACQMQGLVFTPFNWRASSREIAYVLEDAEAKAVAFEGRTEEKVLKAAAAAGIHPSATIAVADGKGGGIRFERLAEAPATGGPIGLDERAVSLMLYTSGTTGRAKGVPRSHAAERTAAVTCIAHQRYWFGESALGVMPLFHTMGIRTLLTSAFLGGKFVCMPTFDAEEALSLIERERIGSLFLVPTLFHDILNHPRFGSVEPRSLRRLGYAGMSMTTALTRQCFEMLRPASFCNHYGSSEIFTFTVCDHLDRKPGCAGRASLNQEVRVVRADPEGNAGPDDLVPPGEAGEVIASMRSPEAFTGYWKRPDADAKAIRRGWYFTGDLGRLDDEGELYLAGRIDDMIISGGENIYPEEVEDALARTRLVRQAAVVGLPDERWGQKVVAFVEPGSQGVTAKRLDAACLASGLARFKRPRAYVFVEEIPRSAAGKLLRRLLRDGEYRELPGFDTAL